MSVTNYLSPTVCNFITGDADPGVTPVYGYKGDIYARKWAGVPALFQKQDNGLTNSWTQITGGGGGAGTPNTFAGFNGGGNLFTVPGFVIDTVGGGMYETLTEQPNNGGGFTANQFSVNFDPLQNSPNENWNIQSIAVFLDVNNSGFSQGTAGSLGQLLNLSYIHQGTGNVGQLNHININDTLGDGLNPITIGGLNFAAANANVNANVTIDGQISGFSFTPTLNAAAIAGATQSGQAFFDGAQFNCAVNSHTSFNASPNFFAINNNSNYNVLLGGGNITTLTGNASYNGVTIGPNITTMGATSVVNGFFFNPFITTMGATSAFVGLSLYGNITTSHGNVTGINVQQTINAGDANYQGLNISPVGTATLPQVNGINVDLSGLASTSKKYGLNINDGIINCNSNLSTTSGFGVDTGNVFFSVFSVAAGSPITGTDFLNNIMTPAALFEDDMDATGPIGVGYVAMGAGGQLGIVAGKTVDSYVSLFAGGSFPVQSTGGTVVDCTTIKVFGMQNAGGALNITNLRGIHVPSFFSSASPTNAWAISVDDPNAENHFEKSISIATATKKVTNSSVGLEIGGTTKAFRASNMTTAQRNALTALAGMVIFNTDSTRLEFYDGAVWQTL